MGLNLVELVPRRDDPRRLSALTAPRIAAVGLALVLRPAGEVRV